MSLLFPISGLISVLCSPVFPPWLSGGTKGKVSLRDSLLDIAVFILLSGRNTVASCLGWQIIFRYSPMSPVLLLRHVLFGFNLDELRILPRVLCTF